MASVGQVTGLRRFDAPQRARAAAVAGLIAVGVLFGGLSAVKPSLVLLALVAAIVIGIGAVMPQWTLALFLFSIPLEYGWEIHGNPSLTVTKVAGALCFLSFAVYALRSGKRLRFDVSHALVVAILCLALASTASSSTPTISAPSTFRYLNWVLLYIVLTQFANEARWVQRMLVWSLVLSAAAAGVWGCLDFLDGATPLATLPFGQQNDYAFILASILFLGLWLMYTEQRKVWRLLASAASAGIIAGIALSLSRGAYLSVSVTLIFFVIAHRRQAKVLIPILLLGAVAIGSFVAVDPGQIKQGVSDKQNVAQANVDSRLTLWQGAIELVATHPLLGIGPGNFGNYYYKITKNPAETAPLTAVHDTYLEILAELGPIGLLLFAAFMILTLQRINESVRTRAGPPELALFLRLSFISISVGILTVSEEFFAPIWLIAGFATLVWLERPCVSST